MTKMENNGGQNTAQISISNDNITKNKTLHRYLYIMIISLKTKHYIDIYI